MEPNKSKCKRHIEALRKKKKISSLIFLTHTTNELLWFKHRLESNQTGNPSDSFSDLFKKNNN